MATPMQRAARGESRDPADAGTSPELKEPQEVLTHEHPSFDDVAAEAYLIYMANGGRHGSDIDDWLEAERRLKGRRAPNV